jgi:preprotein translocase subunit SecF
VELFKQISIDWLGKKWWFFGFSWILIALGVIGYFKNGGLTYGIDFTGGTLIYIKFKEKPDLDLIRQALQTKSPTPPLIQSYGPVAGNEIQARMQTGVGKGKAIESGRREVLTLLRKAFDPTHVTAESTDIKAESSDITRGPWDFNNIGEEVLGKYLLGSDPDNLKVQNKTSQEVDDSYKKLTGSLLDYRNKDRKGLVPSIDDLKKAPGVSNDVVAALNKDFYAGPFAIKGMDSISGAVGKDLRSRATWAVGLSFLGMLVYIAFRFHTIYGVAAVVALFHDLAVTLGLFALTQKEISLTVIAALLTLVGYSMNDTIVVFDRVRENNRLMRKESLFQIINISINQTFARTMMTSLTTFISVLALFVFGGEVLNGFSFTLTVGILIGTYSSIGIASPIVEWWYRVSENKSKKKMV